MPLGDDAVDVADHVLQAVLVFQHKLYSGQGKGSSAVATGNSQRSEHTDNLLFVHEDTSLCFSATFRQLFFNLPWFVMALRSGESARISGFQNKEKAKE